MVPRLDEIHEGYGSFEAAEGMNKEVQNIAPSSLK